MKDSFYKKAKKEGYRARSIYKLFELNKKYNLIKKSDNVLDIGAAPGSWLQACCNLAKFVLGIDIQEIKTLKVSNVKTLKLDINDKDILNKIEGKFNVVISDVAPKTSGIIDIDQDKSLQLSKRAFFIAKNKLVKNGNFLCKIFQSQDVNNFINELRKYFKFVKTSKPIASRKHSKEIYIICKYFTTNK
jgi:23S rRNA (uridine2552-2'-O)-methyltransferase